jgi:hypothetical protein
VLERLFLPLLLALPVASCAARRFIALTSEPTGATVQIDGQVVGSTPVEVPFEHYGVRQVTMTSPGYATWTRNVRVKSPWYGRFPMDVVSEILLPFGWKDRHEVHAELPTQVIEVEDLDLQAVLARARALRAIMEQSQDGTKRSVPPQDPAAPATPSILPQPVPPKD